MKVSLPQKQLSDAGIPERAYRMTLRDIPHMPAQRMLRMYTAQFDRLARMGIGLCIFGDDSEERDAAFYGTAKALLAQRRTMCITSTPEMIDSYFKDRDKYTHLTKVGVLYLTELSASDDSITKSAKSALVGMLRQRADQGLPTVAMTALEVILPDHCLESLYPGIAAVLTRHMALINLTKRTDCEWLRKGHTPDALLRRSKA